MNKNNNLNNGFTTRKSVDGMVGVPRTQGVGGMINSSSSQHASHGKILNRLIRLVILVGKERPLS